jgi:glycosyltransferase involved in cell wall biosynthesis
MGGAERQLVALARGLQQRGHQVALAVFYAGGEFEEELRLAGIPVHDLAKRGRWDAVGLLLRLCRLVKRERPELVHSYLDSPNLVAAVVRRLFPSVKVVWGVRSAMSDFGAYAWPDALGARLERLASPLVDGIITNSEAGRQHLLRAGFRCRRLTVITNGIDCERFQRDAAGRERLRREWGVGADTPLVGMVARLDPVKNHASFLQAAALASATRPDIRFICLGGGASDYQRTLQEQADRLGLGPRLTWLGERRVTSAEYSALDAAVLSSNPGEGFPNVLAEAMACGCPVVATDSGDASSIVGDTGVIVPPRDPQALADGILGLLRRVHASAPELGLAARRRIEGQFSVDALLRQTEQELERIIGGPEAPLRPPHQDAEPAAPPRRAPGSVGPPS